MSELSDFCGSPTHCFTSLYIWVYILLLFFFVLFCLMYGKTKQCFFLNKCLYLLVFIRLVSSYHDQTKGTHFLPGVFEKSLLEHHGGWMVACPVSIPNELSGEG